MADIEDELVDHLAAIESTIEDAATQHPEHADELRQKLDAAMDPLDELQETIAELEGNSGGDEA